MTQEGKDIVGVLLGVTVLILAVVLVVAAISLESKKQNFENQVKCKEIGGSYIYENYQFICK